MSHQTTSDRPNWYAIYTRAKEEDRAESNLRAWGVKTFMPKVRERRGGQSRKAGAVKHLFPRYIFARFDPEAVLHKITYTRGVANVVGFGETPHPVDDFIIEAIQSQVGADGLIQIKDDMSAGDNVTVEDGAFKSLEGTFERELSDRDRMVMLLSSVSYQGRLVIEKALVRKSSRSH